MMVILKILGTVLFAIVITPLIPFIGLFQFGDMMLWKLDQFKRERGLKRSG